MKVGKSSGGETSSRGWLIGVGYDGDLGRSVFGKHCY